MKTQQLSFTPFSWHMAPSILCLILLSVISFSCAPAPEPDFVDRNAMAAINLLAIVQYSAGDHIVFKESSTDNAENTDDSAWLNQLLTQDVQTLVDEMMVQNVSWQLAVIDSSVSQDPRYSEAINSPASEQASVLAGLAKAASADGLLWLEREYRIRATSSPLGDKYTQWTGEVLSHIKIYSAEGQRALDARWIDVSDAWEGTTLKGSEAVALLDSAVKQASRTTVTVLTATMSHHDVLSSLKKERTEAEQEKINVLAEGGVFVRGGIIFGLLMLGVIAAARRNEGTTAARLFFIVSSIVAFSATIYLVIMRGWWKDTILALIRLIKEAIFG